jgi:hypothetical protein
MLKSQLRLAISQAELTILFASFMQLHWFSSENSVTKQKAHSCAVRVEPAAIMLKSQLHFAISQAELTMLFASFMQLHWFSSEISVTKEKARTVP